MYPVAACFADRGPEPVRGHTLPPDKVPLLTDGGSCWTPESAADHGQHHPVATHHPDAGAAASSTTSPSVCQFPSTISLSRCVGPLLLVLGPSYLADHTSLLALVCRV